MSQAPSSNNNQQAQARAQAQQKQDQANQAQVKAFEKASTPENPGTGYGSGRITFDSKGNTLQDGKIVQFAGRQAQESYLAERGYGNNGVILDQSKAANADFSNLQRANISGVVNAEQPIGGFGWNWGGNISGARQITRGSSLEQQIQKSEADRAAKVYGAFENPDYATGGKRESEKPVISLDKAQAFFGKTKSGEYGWKDIGKDQLVRGSAKEEQVKQSEAEKAFSSIPSKSNADYITGGTPEKTSGGVITAKSFGKSAGWSVLAPDQLTRNSPKEEQVKQNEAEKDSVFVKDTSKQGYDTGLGGLTDTNATKNTASLAFLSSGKPLTAEQQQNQNASTILGNGLISLSNKQIAAKNISSDKEFRDYLHKGTEQGAVFSFFVGDKKVGETSGARSYHDYLAARQKYGDNVSVGENFPSREKTLSDAVQKNTAFYSNLPQSYWTALSKEGYFSEKNQGKINEQINLYGKIQSREALASGQGILPAIRFGGIIPTDKGPRIIGPEQNEVASFMKFPFAGQKSSTSFIKSTSYSDILQFYPGIPGLGKALAPASEVWINLIGKGQSKFGEIKTGFENKVRTGIGGKAMEGAINYPKPKPTEPSLEPRIGRNEPTFRPTNPTREKLPTNILSKDAAFGETPVSARPNTPRNTFFEDITKDVQGTLSKTQNDLLKPRIPDTNPPASRNIPFFPGRTDPFGRLFTGNNPAVSTKTTPTNEAVNISGLTSGVSPIRTNTDVSTTGLSPISRDYYGVQFNGIYPESYLPAAAGQIENKAIPQDFTYNPAARSSLEYSRYNKLDVNAILGSSITPKEETTDVGLFNLLRGSLEKVKPKQNEVVHGTDIFSALNIKEKGPKISLKKGQGFHVTEDPFLALSFADMRTYPLNKGGVFVKYNTLTDLLSRATGGRKYLKAEQVPEVTKKQFSAVEGSDIIAHPFTGQPMKEILVTKKDFLIGEPKIIDVSDILAIKNVKPTAGGLSPLKSTYPTGNEIGTIRYGESIEKRENVPVFKESKNKPEEPQVYFNPSGGNKLPSPLQTGERNYRDFISSRFESTKKEESIFDILGKTLPTKAEKLQNYPELPSKPEDLIQAKAIKGGQYQGKSPIDLYSSSSGFSQNPKDIREFLGLAGEKVTGKTSGKLPLEKFNLVAQGGIKEGDIVGINLKSGTYLRRYSDINIIGFGPKTGTAPLDIQIVKSFGSTESRGFTEGKGIFGNAKGAKYYAGEEIYPYGSSFIRGSLKTKDVGLAKFEKYQKEHPEPPTVGNPRIESFFKNLPSRNTKSAIVGNNLFNDKGVKAGFRRTSKNLFEEKKTETKKESGGFSNIGGTKQETVLLQKPQVRRRIITTSEQQYDYGYEFRPIPSTKSENGLVSGVISGLKSGTLPGIKTGSKLESGSLLANLNRNLSGTKPKSGYRQSPKQIGRLFIGQGEKQTPKQVPSLFQSPKQGQTPRQTPKQTPKIPTPQMSKQSPFQFQIHPPFNPPINPPKHPPKLPPPVLLFGSVGRKRGGKNKSGPTGLINLDVNNIFASSLSINVGKNRVEF